MPYTNEMENEKALDELLARLAREEAARAERIQQAFADMRKAADDLGKVVR